MGKSSTSSVYVGLDVNKDSIDIAVAEADRESQVRHVGSIGGDLAALDKALRKLISCGAPLHITYEGGPAGSSSGATKGLAWQSGQSRKSPEGHSEKRIENQ